jgi:hypothetical protein
MAAPNRRLFSEIFPATQAKVQVIYIIVKGKGKVVLLQA